MPSWNQRTMCNWIRLHGPSWTVRVLNTVPGHPNHALNWIDANQLPETFVQGTMVGPYTGPHSADFLRAPALYTYGGVWMDSSCILFRSLDRICWDELADEESPFSVGAVTQYGTVMANAFVAARKGDVFVKKWHEIFMELWRGQTDWSGIAASPLILPILMKMELSEAVEAGFKWKFTVDPGMFCWGRGSRDEVFADVDV